MGKKKKNGHRAGVASARPKSESAISSETPQKKSYPIIVAVIVILVVVAGLWVVKGFAESGNDTATVQEDSASTVDASAAASTDVWALNAKSVDMDAITEANVPAIVDFGSDSCVPCKQMAPVLKKSNEEMQGRAIVKFVDVWKYTDAANGFPVQVIPTQVLMMPGGAPYVPREGLYAELGLEFMEYEDASGQHAFTTHQGALTQEQMDAILADMGA